MTQEFPHDLRAKYEETLAALVRLQTVSSDPTNADAIQQCVAYCQTLLADFGFDVSVQDTGGNPIIYAERLGDPSWPTVLLYNHLDVQPATPDEWSTNPFELTIKDGTYYGRGTTDDKGPALAALFAVQQACNSATPLNFKIVWEFEEEIGSPHFRPFVESNAGLLKADSVLVSDTIWISNEQPALAYGLRGLVSFEISLTTADHDTHSGLTGGVARNPLLELSTVLAACVDAQTGHVYVPGFYDGIVEPTAKERQEFVSAGFALDTFTKSHQLTKIREHTDISAATAIMAQPTFELHGIVGGHQDDGIKTIIPHRATAKVSCRLVPGQNLDHVLDCITKFIQSRCADAKIIVHGKAMPYLCNPANAHMQAATQAISDATGKQPSLVREGGSIGAVLALDECLHAPVVMLGMSLPEHGYHAVDEHFDWRQATYGIRTLSQYFRLIAQL